MSDNEPVPPKGARAMGDVVLALGVLLFVAAAALIVLMFVRGTPNAGGIILALLVAGCGAVALALGSSIKNSRAGKRPSDYW